VLTPGLTNLVSLTLPDGRVLDGADVGLERTYETAGIHELKFADERVIAVAVNLDPAESRTGPLKEEELIRIGVPVQADPATASKALAARVEQQKDAETESRQKNWRWLLAFAVGVFLLESWLAGRRQAAVVNSQN
jgi:hypothetical protein